MSKSSNVYTFMFAAAVCVVCSFLLSFVSASLKSKQELNIEVDVKKNILKAVDLKNPLSAKAKADDVLAMYAAKIDEVVVDQSGKIIEGKQPSDVDFEKNPNLMPLYIYKEGNQIQAYSYPVSGKGLWSTLYGYLAIEPDAKTVRGITFYKHGETPGLGAEIEKEWFQSNFKGKKIWSESEQKINPVAVVKGKVADLYSGTKAKYYVDGISGATLTSQGVTALLDKGIRKYEPFFQTIRK